MAKEYIECREGSFYLIGSRVPLARVVYEFQNGVAPEAIRLDYPTLSLEQVYGAITFYLAKRKRSNGIWQNAGALRRRSSRRSRPFPRSSSRSWNARENRCCRRETDR